MTDLVEQLGEQYVGEFLRGALIRDGNVLYYIKGVKQSQVIVNCLDLLNEKAEWGNSRLPREKLESFKSLAWPKLGYRNLNNDLIGNMVIFFGSVRSVLRGLREEHLSMDGLPIYESFGVDPLMKSPSNNSQHRLRRIFNPVWIPYKEGMQKIREGEIPAFALNEDVAISLSVNEGVDRYCDILYRQKVVGQVSQSGEILVANAIIKKSHLKRLYSLMEV